MFQEKKLKDCLIQIKDSLDIEDNIVYKQVTVSNTGEIKIRGEKLGKKIGTKRQFLIKKGYFIYSRLGLHTGAFGIVPDFLDGAVVTGDMPVFRINEDVVLKDFLILTLNTDFFLDQIKGLNKGVAQSRIREKVFLELKIKIPSIEKQKEILQNYKTFKNNFDKLNNLTQTNQNYITQLKQQILQEAIEGKLTKSWREQNQDIEPASVLLEKIKKEKEELIKQKKLKKQKELKPIEQDEIPFDIPKSWEWCRLGEVCMNIHYGFNASANNEITNIRLVRITDIQDDKVDWNKVPGCVINDEQIEKYILKNNDILIARTGGTIGKSYLVKDINVKAIFASYLIRLIPSSLINANYLKIYLGSNLYWEQLYENSGGAAQPNVNGTALNNLVFTFPPLEEQKQIVKKVDDLMKLCDELEKQTLEIKENSENLMKAVLGEVFRK